MPLPPARDRSRKILMGIVTKVVTEHVLAAGAPAASASSSASSGAAATEPLPPVAREAALAQAEDVGASIEAALHAAYAFPDPGKPGSEYAERFRTLAMGLPRNAPLVLNAFTGALPVGDLVRLSSDELVSDAARRKAEAIREQQ